MDVANPERVRLRIPVPQGKRLVGSEQKVLPLELDDPSDVDRFTLISLTDWVGRKVRAALAVEVAIVGVIEVRPDTPTTVVAHVVVPQFADA